MKDMNQETITGTLSWYKTFLLDGWPGGWGPQGMSATGRGGLARVPNLRVCEHPGGGGWHMQGETGELTSRRGTVESAW